MSTVFNTASLEAHHALQLLSGVESLSIKLQRGGKLHPTTDNERYALSVLTAEGDSVAGQENFAKQALYKVKAALTWWDNRFYKYDLIINRFMVLKLSTAIMKRIYKERTITDLAKSSPYTYDQLLKVVKDPDGEEKRIEVLDAIFNKDLDDNYGFNTDYSPTKKLIALIRKDSNAANTITQAISSAGSVEKLLKKHAAAYQDAEIDTQAFRKIFDTLASEKHNAITTIVEKLDKADEKLRAAERELGGELFLSTHPKELKATFSVNNEKSTEINLVSKVRFERNVAEIRKDIQKLLGVVKKASGESDPRYTVASDLLKTYTSVIDTVMAYEQKVNKAQIYAITVCIEAQYKMLILSARAENKA